MYLCVAKTLIKQERGFDFFDDLCFLSERFIIVQLQPKLRATNYDNTCTIAIKLMCGMADELLCMAIVKLMVKLKLMCCDFVIKIV